MRLRQECRQPGEGQRGGLAGGHHDHDHEQHAESESHPHARSLRRATRLLSIALLLCVLLVSGADAAPLRLHATVDLLDNPPGAVPIFWHGGHLTAGDWCWVEVQTYDATGQPEPWVPITVRVFDEQFKPLQYHTTRTGSDGVTRVRIQSAPTDPLGMWTAHVNRMVGTRGLGDAITFPVAP